MPENRKYSLFRVYRRAKPVQNNSYAKKTKVNNNNKNNNNMNNKNESKNKNSKGFGAGK